MTEPADHLRTHKAPAGLAARAAARAHRPQPSSLPKWVALAAVLLIGVGLGRLSLAPADEVVVQHTASTSTDAVPVRLVLHAPDAAEVRVAGDFNGWDASLHELVATRDGTFQATLLLDPGQHEYMFVVDGEWVTDPSATVVRDDGFGNLNAVLEI